MLLVCLSCTTRYSVGAPCCPHCGSSDHVVAGGPGDPTITPAAPAVEDTPDGGEPE